MPIKAPRAPNVALSSADAETCVGLTKGCSVPPTCTASNMPFILTAGSIAWHFMAWLDASQPTHPARSRWFPPVCHHTEASLAAHHQHWRSSASSPDGHMRKYAMPTRSPDVNCSVAQLACSCLSKGAAPSLVGALIQIPSMEAGLGGIGIGAAAQNCTGPTLRPTQVYCMAGARPVGASRASLLPPASIHLRLERRQHLLEILVTARLLLVAVAPPPRLLPLLLLLSAAWRLLLPPLLLLLRSCCGRRASRLPAAAGLRLAAVLVREHAQVHNLKAACGRQEHGGQQVSAPLTCHQHAQPASWPAPSTCRR